MGRLLRFTAIAALILNDSAAGQTLSTQREVGAIIWRCGVQAGQIELLRTLAPAYRAAGLPMPEIEPVPQCVEIGKGLGLLNADGQRK